LWNWSCLLQSVHSSSGMSWTLNNLSKGFCNISAEKYVHIFYLSRKNVSIYSQCNNEFCCEKNAHVTEQLPVGRSNYQIISKLSRPRSKLTVHFLRGKTIEILVLCRRCMLKKGANFFQLVSKCVVNRGFAEPCKSVPLQ
jgi:hypothetical protein